MLNKALSIVFGAVAEPCLKVRKISVAMLYVYQDNVMAQRKLPCQPFWHRASGSKQLAALRLCCLVSFRSCILRLFCLICLCDRCSCGSIVVVSAPLDVPRFFLFMSECMFASDSARMQAVAFRQWESTGFVFEFNVRTTSSDASLKYCRIHRR